MSFGLQNTQIKHDTKHTCVKDTKTIVSVKFVKYFMKCLLNPIFMKRSQHLKSYNCLSTTQLVEGLAALLFTPAVTMVYVI